MKGLLYFACCSQRIDSAPMIVHECNVKQLIEEQQRLGCWRGFFKEAIWIEGWKGVFHNQRVGSLEHSLHGFFPIHSTPQTQTKTHKTTCTIILETEETEEGRRDEHLRQVILPRISCCQRFGVSRAWRVSIPTPFHSRPGKRKMIWSLVCTYTCCLVVRNLA